MLSRPVMASSIVGPPGNRTTVETMPRSGK
jgi:hypothetical protein